MIFKVVALVAFLGACLAEEHAYSSQSIVRYDDHSHGKENNNGYKQENSYEYSNGYLGSGYEQSKSYEQSNSYEQGNGYEHGYSQDVKIEVPQLKQVTVHKIIPVVKAVPVAHYVSESSHGSESLGLSAYGHEESYNQGYHGHSSGFAQAESSSYGHGKSAVSSQHILREDVPAKAPKDFYEYHGHPKYEFEYKVQDHHTGDNKYQHESRDGHVVKGVYSLHEADGSIRTVEYGSDKHTGFTASIKQTTKHIEEPKHKHY